MTTMPQPPSDSGAATPKPLTRGEAKAVRAVAILAVILGLIGLANSFAAVQHAVADSFGWWAWSAPLGIDIAIAIFTAMDIIHARLDMRTRWLRLAPWTLVAVTIYLNVAPEPTLVGKVAHGALPILWVVAVEVGAHTIRHRMGLASPTRMERIRRARWLLAPTSTAGLWRRMVLWEERSYTAALRRERDRLLAKAELRETYGRKWRKKAPRRTMVLLKIGELAPSPQPAPPGPEKTADVPPSRTAIFPVPDGTEAGPDDTHESSAPTLPEATDRRPDKTLGASVPDGHTPVPDARPDEAHTTTNSAPTSDSQDQDGDEDESKVADPDPRIQASKGIVEELSGTPWPPSGTDVLPSRETLIKELRQRGYRCGTDTGTRLLKILTAELTAGQGTAVPDARTSERDGALSVLDGRASLNGTGP